LHHPSQTFEEQSFPLSGQRKFPCSFGSGVLTLLPLVLKLPLEVQIHPVEFAFVEVQRQSVRAW
jgi:hypothetical protein